MLIDRVVRAVALYCGGAVLAVLMMVILIDVIGRYVFNSPLYGSLDLAVVLLVLPCPARSGTADGPARTSPPTWSPPWSGRGSSGFRACASRSSPPA